MHWLLCSITLVLIPGIVVADIPPRFQDSINYVKALQTKSGGFLPTRDKAAKPSLRATLGAVRAIKYFGGKTPNKKQTQSFVADCFNADKGGFADAPGGEVTVFSTSLGIMAVVDLRMNRKPFEKAVIHYLTEHATTFEDIRIAAAAFDSMEQMAPKAKDWIAVLRKEQNKDGSFGTGDGKARMTGSAVAAILRLGGKISNKADVLKAMKTGQQINGGFGKEKTPFDAELATSYRVMRSLYMLDAQPEDIEGLRSFVEKCRNEDGGYSIAPARPSSVGTTYFAGIILHWLKDDAE